jgi:hypothetical protein
MDAAFPVEVEDVLWRIVGVVHDDLFEHGAQDAFLQLHGRRGMLPQQAEIAPEFQQPFLLSWAQRLGLRAQREDTRLEIGHVFERLIPPSLEFARHQAVLGISRIELPLRPSRLIPGLL